MPDKPYVPDMGMDYPKDDPFKRLLTVEVEDSSKGKYQFDETYPYLDNSFTYKWNRFLGWFVQWIAADFWNLTHFGLRIEGRKNLRGYKKQLKGGAMCVCNHVYLFDALSVYQATRRPVLRIPMYAKHFNGKMGWFMKYVGGIPVPETPGGLKAFNEAFDEYHRRGDWMLIFPEAVRWNWYTPIRPFKRGAFAMAYKYDIPVIPFAITFRERKGLYRLFGPKSLPCATLHVGKPILVDRSARKKQEVDRLREEAHAAMVEMSGTADTSWPASWGEE
jgi:1-acyl-sn-glycerol-3-phosphate acyltransferase